VAPGIPVPTTGWLTSQAIREANAADPVCPKSPHHEIVNAALESATNPDRQTLPLIFRTPKESRRLIDEAIA